MALRELRSTNQPSSLPNLVKKICSKMWRFYFSENNNFLFSLLPKPLIRMIKSLKILLFVNFDSNWKINVLLFHSIRYTLAHNKVSITASFFLYFRFSIQLTINVQNKILPMTGFVPRTSGIGSDRSTNWDTTTASYLAGRYQPTIDNCWKEFVRLSSSSHHGNV